MLTIYGAEDATLARIFFYIRRRLITACGLFIHSISDGVYGFLDGVFLKKN